MRWMITIVCGLLVSCAPDSQKAEEEYRIVAEKAFDERDKCAAARKVEAAYLREGDVEQYEIWNLRAENECRQ